MRIKLLTLLGLLSILLTGCAAEKTPIRIGVNSWPPCEVWTVAEEQGYFGDVPVELVRFSAWADNMNSLYQGKTDITHATYFNAVYYADKGESAVMLAPIDTVLGGDGMVVRKGLEKPDALRGKRIAVEIGTDEHYLLFKALERMGLGIGEVELVSIPSYESHEAFIRGEVDAVFTYEPFLTQAAEQGDGTLVFSTRDLPGHMVDALMVREAVAKGRSEDIRKVMAAWYEALEYIRKNPDVSYERMAALEGMSPEDFGPFFEGFTFFGREEAIEDLRSDRLANLLADMKAFATDNNLLDETADTGGLLDSPLLK